MNTMLIGLVWKDVTGISKYISYLRDHPIEGPHSYGCCEWRSIRHDL